MVRYSSEIAAEIVERLAKGESLRAICEDPHMPDESTVRAWVLDNVEGFGPHYARAREIGYARLAEEIVQIADTPVLGEKETTKEWGTEISKGDMIEHRKLQVDTRKWILSKMLPKVYGDKQQVEHSGNLNVASVLTAARKRSGRG